METKTDSNRPSTIRIIAGSLVMLCYVLIFWICLDGMVYFMNHYPPRKFPLFEHLWGKLAFIFISGMTVIITIGIAMSLIFAAVKIWGGKSESPGHIIYPFPAVLTLLLTLYCLDTFCSLSISVEPVPRLKNL